MTNLPPRPFRLVVSLSRVTRPGLRAAVDWLCDAGGASGSGGGGGGGSGFAAERGVTLYEQHTGTYPRILEDGTREHGGLPDLSEAFLARHFDTMREDVVRQVPAGFTGHVVLDYETSPVLAHTPERYRLAFGAAHPTMTPEQLALEWSERVVTLHTLSLGCVRDTLRDHAPGATCGFYGYFDGSALPDTDPPIHTTVVSAHALYPSWYARKPLASGGEFGRFVRGCAASMARCERLESIARKPVFPFIAAEHTGLGRDGMFLSGADTRRMIATAWRLGAAGVVLWGDMRSEAHQRDQEAWIRGPFARAWREVANPARATEIERSFNAEEPSPRAASPARAGEGAEKSGGGA